MPERLLFLCAGKRTNLHKFCKANCVCEATLPICVIVHLCGTKQQCRNNVCFFRQQGYKFYCRLKETLIEKYPDLIKWWNVIHAALLKKKYIIFDGFNFYSCQSFDGLCTLSANYATLYSLKTIKIYQKYRLDIRNFYILNINQKAFKERFEIKGCQINPISEEERILIKRK